MSYKAFVYSRCRRKIRHATRAEAQRAIDSLVTSGAADKANLRMYHCDQCGGGYHVGRKRCSQHGVRTEPRHIIRSGSVLLAGH